ncbi:hypothetical protein GRF59_22230 [Paenibacillus sp. HJL G12]|uniref:Aminoglycoside phosphotransferase n=1 Tax=Paenibacillus dendrobii TaxID=2691084 RepID=A0A7X3LHX5_9BACL|nr:hypothetical protein [Paenibacillus dendrobii]MWV46326.1 hypothetical protein [Paenibacillus dendrobii]
MSRKEVPPIEAVRSFIDGKWHSDDYRIARERSGVSTYVYRVWNDKETFYLRILPEQT